jgi:hypothetical protein
MAVAIGETNPSLRLKHVISLYTHAIETLAQREPTASVILCCIPQMVIDHCMERVTQSGQKKPPKATKAERKARESAQAGQIFLFREMDPTLGIEEEEPGHQNLRRGLKAEAMQYGIPTQLVWPKTLQVRDTSTGNSASKVQDVATRAWNFMTGLYHKAGGSPWRLADIEPNVCFVGISFYREVTENNPRLHTSMAQVFTSSGDGYVLRGNSFEWNLSSRQRSPHLDEKAAAALLRDVLDLYQRQNQGSLPSRMVVHKTSRYWDEELAGFEQACELIPLGFEFFREIYAWNPSFDGKKLYR